MKKILKLSSLAFLLIATVACENDNQTIVQAKGGPELISPLDGAEYVLSPLSATNEVTTLVWNHAEYSQQTEVNYTVEVAVSGTDFASIVLAGTTTNRFVTWTVEALNAAALEAGLVPYTQGDLDVRIKSALGSNADLVSYSNVITLKITPYTTDLPQLAVPGNHQSWDPPSAPRIASSGFGKTDYEGYVSLDGEFKFVGPDASGVYDWNAGPDYGDDGTFSGVLVETGESNINVSAGYYRVKANTGAVSATNLDGLTWSTTLVSWGIIGSATPTGWDSDTDMSYNSTTKKWSITIPLVEGEIKFRYNDTWNVGDAQYNLGLFDAGKTGQNYGGEDMSYGGGNISVATAGNYLVELDLSNPRAYKFTLTAQ